MLFLQTVAGWSALEAGAPTLPLSILMLFLASRIGNHAAHHGAGHRAVSGR